ncbi:unnamed protein product [Phyllotreta striolata]|uniref:Uncharacterized protein n=1 Tax=Phyllotreta striolata TaxID=444603 RepID=A0A9N9XN71_PHYSR|nr:unnamed protein product [Phyllotreta striolata]
MYPEGMLDRDLRTAKVPILGVLFSDNFVPNRTSSISCNASIITSLVRRNANKFNFCLLWKRRYLLPRYQRLKNVLLVIVYLMLTILPTTHSAPSTMYPTSTRKTCTAKWLKNCLTQVKLAEVLADNDKSSFTEYPNWVNTLTPAWLPNVGKRVDDTIPQDVLEQLTVDETLPSIYANLKTLGTVLEEAVRDLNGKPMHGHFVAMRDHNSAVLYVLRQVMEELGVATPDDADGGRQIVPSEVLQAFRRGELTMTSTFTTLIYRECLNNYQYARQALDHLYERLNAEQDGCS